MISWSSSLIRCCAATALIVVVGCSGASDGGPTAPPGAPEPQQVEFESFALVNVARTEAGVEPSVSFRDDLARVARAHSEDMRDQGYFAHLNGRGETVSERLTTAGISFRAAGENLASTTNIANPAAWAHDRLMASEEHRPNILSPRFSLMGVGRGPRTPRRRERRSGGDVPRPSACR